MIRVVQSRIIAGRGRYLIVIGIVAGAAFTRISITLHCDEPMRPIAIEPSAAALLAASGDIFAGSIHCCTATHSNCFLSTNELHHVAAAPPLWMTKIL